MRITSGVAKKTDWEDIKDSQYDKPFISAKGLVIGTISNNRKNSE